MLRQDDNEWLRAEVRKAVADQRAGTPAGEALRAMFDRMWQEIRQGVEDSRAADRLISETGGTPPHPLSKDLP